MSLIEKVERNVDAKAWYGEIPLQNRYTCGLAGERFFREIKDKAHLVGTRCTQCDYTYVPPTIYCERCLSKLEQWVEVGPEGTVESFTVVMVGLDGSPLTEPQVMALIRLDGADSVMVHRLGNVRLDQLAMGMRVKAVFKPKKKREGSILDIEGFAPVS